MALESKTTIKNLLSKVGATGITIHYRVDVNADGVKSIFGAFRRDDDQANIGYVNHDRAGDRLMLHFAPFSTLAPKDRKAIIAAVMADIDHLLAPAGDGQ